MCGEYLLPPLSKVRAVCGSTACTDLRGGRRVIGVPTATTENLPNPMGKQKATFGDSSARRARYSFNFPQRDFVGVKNRLLCCMQKA
jgi:hypothetical protein